MSETLSVSLQQYHVKTSRDLLT